MVLKQDDIDSTTIPSGNLVYAASTAQARQLNYYTALAGDVNAGIGDDPNPVNLRVGMLQGIGTSLNAESNQYLYENPPLNESIDHYFFIRVFSSQDVSLSCNV